MNSYSTTDAKAAAATAHRISKMTAETITPEVIHKMLSLAEHTPRIIAALRASGDPIMAMIPAGREKREIFNAFACEANPPAQLASMLPNFLATVRRVCAEEAKRFA